MEKKDGKKQVDKNETEPKVTPYGQSSMARDNVKSIQEIERRELELQKYNRYMKGEEVDTDIEPLDEITEVEQNQNDNFDNTVHPYVDDHMVQQAQKEEIDLGPPLDFLQEGQDWVLINLAHQGISPKCDEPSIRVVCIGSKKQIMECYVDMSSDKRLTFFMVPSHGPFLMSSKPERTKPEYIKDALRKIMFADKERRELDNLNFKKRVSEKDAGPAVDRKKENRKQKDSKREEKARKLAVLDHINRLERKREEGIREGRYEKDDVPLIRDKFEMPRKWVDTRYRFMAVVFILDRTEKNPKKSQPIFYFLAAFQTETECKRYIKGTASKKIEHNIDCVDAYEWLYPITFYENIDKVTVEYKNKQIQDTINSRKEQQVKAEMCKEEFPGQFKPLDIEVAMEKDKKKKKKKLVDSDSEEEKNGKEEKSSLDSSISSFASISSSKGSLLPSSKK